MKVHCDRCGARTPYDERQLHQLCPECRHRYIRRERDRGCAELVAMTAGAYVVLVVLLSVWLLDVT